MKILIVDDMETNRKLLRAQLEAEGCDVFEACDGIEALEVLRRHPVAAVISDILMPRMDGYHLCDEIRKSDAFGAMPFIIYTATYTSPSDRERSLRLGADLFIKKPASAKVIADVITKVTTEDKYRKRRLFQPLDELPSVEEYSEPVVTKLEKKDEEFMKKLLSTFKAEAADHIHTLSTRLTELEKSSSAETQMEKVEAAFREAHSLKGAARSVKAAEIEAVCESMESAFSAVRKKEISLSPSLLDHLRGAVDALQSLAASLETDRAGAGRTDAAGISRILENFVKRKEP